MARSDSKKKSEIPLRSHKGKKTVTDSKKKSEIPLQSLKRKRSCTDIPCCILFILFIICFVILSIFAFQEGNPKQLVLPTDSEGNLCGSGDFKDKPYLYFFDWTECYRVFDVTKQLIDGRPFVCPTTQVCVDKCPTGNSYHRFWDSYKSNIICKYNISATEDNIKDLVKNKECVSYTIESKPLFHRCVPKDIANLLNNVIPVNGTNVTDFNGEVVSVSKLKDGVKYFVELLNLKQIGIFLVEDFTTSWYLILIALSLSAILSFIWIVLLRWLAKPLIWFGIIAFILMLALGTGFSFLEFLELRTKNNNTIVDDFKFVADASYYRSLPITWLVVGIICALLLLISCLILIAIFKRLRLALALLQEASKAVGYNFFSLFWPFIPFVLQLGVFAYWAVVAVHLASAGKPIYRIALNNDTDNLTTTTLKNGAICKPYEWHNTSEGQCVFFEYGYDPEVNLDKILNGTGKHFNSFIAFVNKNQWLPQFFSVFMLFWLTQFIVGLGQMTLAGIYARYYWNRETTGMPCSSLCASLTRALLYHLGTIAMGSLIIAIVKLIRAILEYVEGKVKAKTGRIGTCLSCCCKCCLWCLEKFLKFLNRNAYILTAIYGKGFFTSARKAFKIIVSNPLRLLVIDKVCDFLIFLGKLCITLGIGILAYFFFTGRIARAEKYVPELHYYFIPLFTIIIGTYIICSCFFSVFSMAVDTLFICCLEDLQLHDENPNHNLMMSSGLRKIFKIKK